MAPSGDEKWVLRAAHRGDGASLWALVKAAGTLELNSAYFYLLFAEHFGRTCLVAEEGGRVLGGIIAYRPPEEQGSLFVWQIGVLEEARGRGLGKRMLHAILGLPACEGVTHLTATVAQSNLASERLFRGFARETEVPCEVSEFFTQALFPSGHAHEAERLFRIGPLHRRSS